MVRDKNPKISPDAVGSYVRNVRLDTGGKVRDVQVEYTACLVDSEDISVVKCTCWDGGDSSVAMLDCIKAIGLAVSPLRVELAEYADYMEAHRACQ